MTTNFRELLQTLVTGNVEFIIVGGAAATAHGSRDLLKTSISFIAARPKTSRA